jgi:hypothetical protein
MSFLYVNPSDDQQSPFRMTVAADAIKRRVSTDEQCGQCGKGAFTENVASNSFLQELQESKYAGMVELR